MYISKTNSQANNKERRKNGVEKNQYLENKLLELEGIRYSVSMHIDIFHKIPLVIFTKKN